MMNVANITESNATITFSARRCSQRPMIDAVNINREMDMSDRSREVGQRQPAGLRWQDNCAVELFDLVDPLERALRPVFAVLVDVALLCERTKCVLIRLVYLLAFLSE